MSTTRATRAIWRTWSVALLAADDVQRLGALAFPAQLALSSTAGTGVPLSLGAAQRPVRQPGRPVVLIALTRLQDRS